MNENINHVKRSEFRKKVMKSLYGNAKMPSEISRQTGMSLNHVSVTLFRLKERELVVCINPEVRKGRLYRLTDEGEEIVRNLESE